MKKYKGLWFVALVVLLPIIALAAVKWYESRIESLPYYGENYQVVPKSQSLTVPSFAFVNHNGVAITDSDIKGKVWVACYFFTTCPTICPLMINGLKDIQKQYASNEAFKIIAFTVDPKTDTPDRLMKYAKARDIQTGQWHLATGSKSELYSFARKGLQVVATDGDGGPGDFIHSDKLILIDQQKHIRGYYDGTEPSEIAQLSRDIARLLENPTMP